jgi:peptidylprolyl isomerase
MNLFMRLLIILLTNLIIFSACQKKEVIPTKVISKIKSVNDIPVKVKKSPLITQEFDTISRKNTIEFLTAYGKENPETDVLIETRLGDIKIRLYRDTPIHRASFIFLTKVGYFSTTCVHRIVQDFVVQGGNSEQPKTRRFRSKYQSYTIPAEFRENRKHKYGALAAARDWDNNPNKRSTPFEFYFVQNKNGSYHLDGEHTVFGEIISGFDTLEKIALVEVGNDEWPVEDVFFKVSVLK